MTAPFPPSDRTRVRRAAHYAHYERATLHAIIDDAYVCHVAFADASGTHNIPTACWREGEYLYIHGSNGGRMMKVMGQGTQVCVAITHLDGLVLARTAFNHSMNYRSAMIYGAFEAVDGAAEKRHAMEVFMNRIAPGRHADVGPGSDKEFDATTIMRIGLGEAACKVREGGPRDDEEDLALPSWAGVLPFARQRLAPVRDAQCTSPEPEYLAGWARR
ncbi:pyridoxamine 5'-phosphate oxidase family protein [Massilia sp. PAMC28688]|uniref:pyridoxamine 5'-phosphate oxidase family protein n=1 Tax=Massilia sp. PAMC28688 TaxID=2861283 RepID=UPI001C630990|nr:pyridoxamine 5'-phosphate oxidase family protein [Massilia sp. PAMC28688]QYF93904.1 pyridoxamine 5'-phosphate oxidase family protein [Massilia sp. PAMC28688]